MRLARLRHQMLLAMGLPAAAFGATACWNQQASDRSTAAVTTEADLASTAATCARDSVRETVCGTRNASTSADCGARGSSLARFGTSRLSVTVPDDPRRFHHFELDAEATAQYRQRLAHQNVVLADQCCYSSCTLLDVGNAAPLRVAEGHRIEKTCIPKPPGGTSVPAPDDPACPAGVRLQGELRPHTESTATTCCYGKSVVDDDYYRPRAIPGRAARIDDVPRTAEVARTSVWIGDALSLQAVPASARARLAAWWLAAAQLEHASIAAFSSVALRLLALGAPADLIRRTHEAALDEIEHARIAFAIASAYAGEPLGPGAFADATRLPTTGDLRALAIETFVDGCIGETVAALAADEAARTATDPAVAAALARIAADETRHAELAWSIVAWCARAMPSLADELQHELERALRDGGAAAATATDADAALAVHGVQPASRALAVRRAVLHDVVAPCLAALRAAA